MNSLVEKAATIARRAHEGQFRRDGVTPYIRHPEAVASRVAGDPDAEAVAWLHDVIEDTTETAESLLADGIPQHVVDAVVLLTKTDDTPYLDFVSRVIGHPLAEKVKIADLLSNLADNPSSKQIRKYAAALLLLVHED